jgi:imidazoleglycerol-phosphate dehydratase
LQKAIDKLKKGVIIVNRRLKMDELVGTLKEIQKNNGYTDQKMAEKIGVSRPYYNRIRMGKVPIGPVFRLKVIQAFPLLVTRSSTVKRKTRETDISLELNLDGSGQWQINSGIKMFDHLLSQLAQHGRFDLKLAATGDDQHHLIEDVAICLGQAFNQALGEKRGIIRMGDAAVPMDDALAMVAVDISGRGYTVLELDFSQNSAEWQLLGFPPDLIRHFLESFAIEAKLNLNANVTGRDDHHKAEAVFKALGRALDMATAIDKRISGELPSTKELLA